MSQDNKQVKDALGDVFTSRMRDISAAGDGTLMRSMIYATLFPNDYGPGGIYQHVGQSGIMAANIAAGSTIYAFQWPGSMVAVVKRVTFNAFVDSVAFAGGTALFDFYVARNYTAPASGGTVVNFTNNNAKLRTSMAQSQSVIVVPTTAALVPGTRTLDRSPMARANCQMPQTANTIFFSGTLLNKMNGEHPLVLATQEGFVIQATSFPPVGTWQFNVVTEWEELPLY